MHIPLLAVGDWGLAIVILIFFVLFVIVTWFMIQAVRQQMYWRRRAEEGDVDALQMMLSDEVERWKTMKMPKGDDPATWHGVQTAEIVDIAPDTVTVSAIAEGQYQLVGGMRREVSNAFREGLKVTAKLADMLLYDVPNVRLPRVRIDIYTGYRDDAGATQRCIMTTTCERDVAATLDWDETPAEEIVAAFGGRYSLDDRGNAMPIDVDSPARTSVPAVFYEEE